MLFWFIKKIRILFIFSLSLGLLVGCGYNPKHETLPVELSEEWQAAEEATLEYTAANSDWWRSFQSPDLNKLIARALENSPDLQMAQQRILQAEAQLGVTRANALPHLDASLGGSLGSSKKSGESASSSKSSNLGLSTSYEIDLWGRVAAERAASEATLASKVYDWHATRLTLTAAVASGWFNWLVADGQQRNAVWYLQAAEQQLAFIEAGYKRGSATRVELARQRKQVLTRQANLKKLTHQKLQANHALALLLGESPQQFKPPEAQLMRLTIPRPNPGLPTDILSRRPDLAREEAQLKAVEANVEVARKAIYPSLNLNASARLASDNFSFSDPTQNLSLGANLVQSIFDFGKRRRQIELSEARQQEMLLSYYKTVLTALAEVEDALSNEQLTRELEIQQQKLIEENRLIATNTERLYKAGAEKLTNLLDAQLDELKAEDQLLELYQNRLNASLSLYKVLGGGWKAEIN
ncbi:efflux transporter outer membrane subunit [Marinospirillum insulare]|uniref:Efflux transporter, outer membrane factor (OMF) lipoprotein, NodT family n=1 Tax=Marinospirillum insulare TaxID=217169 RepID=A0ABQ5ZTW5_9GAMM|nr:efflux transporter outer membrane subunit [Marinospirillum insulare]GLR63610.1 hypothetical protein GCM10007878_10450 [Marinospirillum insulare]